MLEWFNSIVEWIEVNSEAIIGALSSLNLGGIAANLFYAFKQRKTIVANTAATSDLGTSAKEMVKTTKAVEENTAETKALNAEVVNLKNENEALKETVSHVMSKIDSILEVMNVVYGTLKDETVRVAVQNIILNAKYAETETRALLQKQIDELQAKIAEDAELLKSQAKETVEKITNIVSNDNHTSRF